MLRRDLAGVFDEVERDAVVELEYREGAVRGRLGQTKHAAHLAGGAPGVLRVNQGVVELDAHGSSFVGIGISPLTADAIRLLGHDPID
jgi:tryptophan synthase beta subunit